MTKNKAYLIVAILYLSFLLGGLTTLLIIPSDYLDDKPSQCPSMILFHKPCFACGLTKASLHFLHGEFDIASHFNPNVIWVVPVLSTFYLTELGALIYHLVKRKMYYPLKIFFQIFHVKIRLSVLAFIFAAISFFISLILMSVQILSKILH